MEGKRYFTRIDDKHEVYGSNPYVHGVIMGIMSTISYGDPVGCNLESVNHDETIMQIVTTADKYALFMERVEERYPGLCEFDYDMTKEE